VSGEHEGGYQDEQLDTAQSSPWVIRLVLLIIAVCVAAVLVYEQTHTHSTSPEAQHTGSSRLSVGSPSPSANDVLVPGFSSGSSVIEGRVVLTAELINTSQFDLAVRYPIRLLGAIPATMQLLFAELASKAAETSHLRPPRLTHIGGHEHVVLWMAFRVRCAQRGGGPLGPAAIAVPLAGLPAPATFSFSDLFDRALIPSAGQVCHPHSRR
jgi:hypothetical protein